MLIPTGTAVFSYWPVALIAIIIVTLPYIRQISVWLTTLVHEIGHGIIAWPLSGFRGGISVGAAGDGETTAGGLLKPFLILSLLMGYGFPIHFGAALLVSLYLGFPDFISVSLGILAFVMVVSIRSLFTGLIVAGYMFVYIFSLVTPHFELKVGFAVFLGVTLLVQGLVDMVMASRLVFGAESDFDSDFEILEDEAWLDRKFWYIFTVALHASILVWAYFILLPVLEAIASR
jgi:hypothetical protein